MSSTNRIETIHIQGLSDGDAARWPARGLSREDPIVYRTKLATRWMKENGRAQKGVKYILDRLPDGYAVFGKKRLKDPEHIDRYLYGHSRYTFRSAEEFFDHFKNLTENGSAQGCHCLGCDGGRSKKSITGRSSLGRTKSVNGTPGSAPRAAGQAGDLDMYQQQPAPFPPSMVNYSNAMPTSILDGEAYDHEGVLDVYQHLVRKLKTHQVVDEKIEQLKSFDWRIDRAQIGTFFDAIRRNPSFLPRVGEIVLFVRDIPHGNFIMLDPESNRFKIWHADTKTFSETPKWEAGLLTQAPEEDVSLTDLMYEEGKTHQVNYSGYRVEPISEVGTAEKPWSKRVAHVPLHHLRPFILYRQILKGTKPPQYHPTIKHTLLLMRSFSLLEKYHFKGVWPSATIFVKGIYMGLELITKGDVVRLLPVATPKPREICDVMQVTSIKLKLLHLDAAENAEYDSAGEIQDNTEGISRSYDSCVHICGMAFTNDSSRAWGNSKLPIDVKSNVLPRGLAQYGDWYHLHDPSRRWEVPFSQLMGRCYDAEAMRIWLHSTPKAFPSLSAFQPINSQQNLKDDLENGRLDESESTSDLSAGLTNMLEARIYALNRDLRIDKSRGKTWFWADTRIEQLDLHEVHGIPVTEYVHGLPSREPDAWKRALAVRAKGAGFKSKLSREEELHYAHAVGRGRGRPRKEGSSMLAASAVGGDEVVDSGDDDEEDGDDVMDDLHPDMAQEMIVDQDVDVDQDMEGLELEE